MSGNQYPEMVWARGATKRHPPDQSGTQFQCYRKRPPGRPKKTWDNAVRELLKARRLSEVDALNRVFWRSTIQGRPANLSQLGQGGNR